MAEDTLSGPFDFALKFNAQDKLMRRFAQGDRCESGSAKNDMFPRDAPGNRRDRTTSPVIAAIGKPRSSQLITTALADQEPPQGDKD